MSNIVEKKYNRYGKPFYSPIDYVLNVPPMKSKNGNYYGFSSTRIPQPREVAENVQNLASWGFKTLVDQDVVVNKYGVLMFTIPSSMNEIDDINKENDNILYDLIEKGYEIEIHPCFYQMSNGLAQNRHRCGGEKPNVNGVFCTNYKKFSVPKEDIKYTRNAIAFLPKEKQEQIFAQYNYNIENNKFYSLNENVNSIEKDNENRKKTIAQLVGKKNELRKHESRNPKLRQHNATRMDPKIPKKIETVTVDGEEINVSLGNREPRGRKR